MRITGRIESDVFADLGVLTAKPGYIHAIAYICHRDNMVAFQDEYTASDLSELYDPSRLLRTEINTLLGLIVRQPLDLTLPEPAQIQAYIEQTDELMAELHGSMNSAIFDALKRRSANATDRMAIWEGAALREPIFYGPESAYSFQYRDFFVDKHGDDDAWLQQNKGFTSRQAQTVARTMCSLMDSRATRLHQGGKQALDAVGSPLASFEFTTEDVARKAGLDIGVVQALFEALTCTGQNAEFRELGDYNCVVGTPLLPTDRGSVLLFMHYAIYEALYESPFFWMKDDPVYRRQASDNRGAFVERFAHRRLAAVFGKAKVFTNVNILDGKNRAGEADVLVIFGDRIIIVQAKAKKLTLAARKGSDGQLKADFAASIQRASDQAWDCAEAILSGRCRMIDEAGREIAMPDSIKEIFPFCVVSDHYPALALQASQYLEYKVTDIVRAPLVMDVFLLDVLAEMLDSPLRLLSYVRLRVIARDKLRFSHELVALGYHLNQNLWLDPTYSMASVDDSFTGDLDVAMTVRREGVLGKRTPPGILTHMLGTQYEYLIAQIERAAVPAMLELGFVLLSLDGSACQHIHQGIAGITGMAVRDGRPHDFTFAIDGGEAGITFHCYPEPEPYAIEHLKLHCEKRKYVERAATWFGVSVSTQGNIQFGMMYNLPWAQSDVMDELTKGMRKPVAMKAAMKILERGMRHVEPGRNEACPCGSGRKYKKCCRA
ncbi:nuclease-related domain-containing protein [Pseudomonas sp. sia0905]|uniref:nuclease-related domain-containing protein n=1 Tax=Pseudomonas sp. sia0905 TaxID=2854783 RepID=UPI001C472B55|nr:nuclease-related domain-containing protein [Pseudomonas sp. sia0905]MBV7563674.1 SEC-C domain-containing protein [Pseudomonas sp. sia0905]